MAETEKSRKKRFTGNGMIKPGANPEFEGDNPMGIVGPKDLLKKLGQVPGKIAAKIREAGDPEKTQEWKDTEAKIKQKQAAVGGIRDLKRRFGQ